jgi:hypothetical protein
MLGNIMWFTFCPRIFENYVAVTFYKWQCSWMTVLKKLLTLVFTFSKVLCTEMCLFGVSWMLLTGVHGRNFASCHGYLWMQYTIYTPVFLFLHSQSILLIKPLVNSCQLLSFLLPFTKYLITLYCHIILPTSTGDVTQFDRACLCRYVYFLEEQHVIYLCTSDTICIV